MKEEQELRLAHALISLVGVGYLFPFSALTQPVDFWTYVFPDFNIEFPLTTVFMWVNLLCLGAIVFLGRKPSYTFRIVGGFIGQAVVLVAVPSLYFLHLSENSYYYAIMASTAVAAVVTALVDSVAIGFAAHYPTRVQEGLQLGIGLSTLIGSVYRIVTKLLFPPDEVVVSSLIYFYSGGLTVLLCIAVYYRLLGLEISRKYFRPHTDMDTDVAADADTDSIAQSTQYGAVELTGSRSAAAAPGEAARLLVGVEDQLPTATTPLDKWTLLQTVLWNECQVFFLFFSTLLLWPALVTEIPSYNFPALQASRWWSLLLLLFFALMDCLGRGLTPYRCGLTHSNIGWAVGGRLLLIPLLVCSAKGLVFTHDAFTVLFIGLLGFTNGFVGSLSIIFVNEIAQPEHKGVVGSFSGFFLNLGLVMGSTAALLVKSWLDSW